jgi:hypothetical protein
MNTTTKPGAMMIDTLSAGALALVMFYAPATAADHLIQGQKSWRDACDCADVGRAKALLNYAERRANCAIALVGRGRKAARIEAEASYLLGLIANTRRTMAELAA